MFKYRDTEYSRWILLAVVTGMLIWWYLGIPAIRQHLWIHAMTSLAVSVIGGYLPTPICKRDDQDHLGTCAAMCLAVGGAFAFTLLTTSVLVGNLPVGLYVILVVVTILTISAGIYFQRSGNVSQRIYPCPSTHRVIDEFDNTVRAINQLAKNPKKK